MAEKPSGVIFQDVNLGGIADSIYTGLPHSLASIVGFDLHSVPGLIIVNQKLAHHSPIVGDHLVDDLCKIVPASNGKMYLFGKTTGKIWEVNGNTYTLLGTVAPAAGAAGILDAMEYYGYLYYAMQNRLGRISVGGAWGTRNDNWATFLKGCATDHPMKKLNLVLYIGDANVVAQVDASTDGGVTHTFSNNALDIETSEVVQTLGRLNTNILVGSKCLSGVNSAGVYVWNTWTESFDFEDHITEDGINAFFPHNTDIIVNAGLNGNLYAFNGSKLLSLKQIPPNFPTLYSPTNTGRVYHSAVENKMGIPIFGFSRVTGNPALQGIYSLGYKNISYPRILTLEFPIPAGNLSNITIWSIALVGNDLYVSYMDEAVGGTVKGVAKLDWSNKIDGAYFETKVIKFTKTLMDKFTKFVSNYNQKPTGASLELWYKINHGSYVQFDEGEGQIVADSDRKQYSSDQTIEAKTMQLKVVARSTGNNSISIEDLITILA